MALKNILPLKLDGALYTKYIDAIENVNILLKFHPPRLNSCGFRFGPSCLMPLCPNALVD